jgi:hypothetical protein
MGFIDHYQLEKRLSRLGGSLVRGALSIFPLSRPISDSSHDGGKIAALEAVGWFANRHGKSLELNCD